MSLARDEGIITARRKYSETSYLVNWITREHGLITTLARGAARPKQALHGKVDLLYECDLSWTPSRSGHLHKLTEVHLKNPHREAQIDYSKQLCVSYAYEVLSLLVEADSPVPEHYETFLQLVEYLDKKPASQKLMDRFERRVLENMGLNDPDKTLAALRHDFYPRLPKTGKQLRQELLRN